MRLIPKKIIIVFLFLTLNARAQQSTIQINTNDKGFSAITLRAANEKLSLYNKYGTPKVALAISIFQLPAIEMRVGYQEPKPDEKKQLGELIKVAEDPFSAEKNQELFLDLATRSNEKAKGIFNKKSDKDNFLFINISLGKSYAQMRSKETEETHSYYQYSILKGEKVREEITEDLTSILESFKKESKKFDFDPIDNYTQNGKNLSELIAGLFTDYSMPITLSWEEDNTDGRTSGWDTNKEEFIKNYPSFQTKPVLGLPWKCIPSDNTFVPLKVEVGISETGAASRLSFRLTNIENFKLKSPTLDNNGLLWIACNTKNKETAIVPQSDGSDSDIYRANVIGYEKIVKTVSVVLIVEENDDIQLVKPGTKDLNPDAHVVEPGPNGFLDTRMETEKDRKTYGHDDVLVCDDKMNCYIAAGPNGVCDTFANNENIEPVDLSLDLNQLETLLNSIYNSYQVEWRVEKVLYRKLLNYDKDGNGYYDPDSFTIENGKAVRTSNQEEEVIYNNARIGNSSHYLFFVKGVNNQTIELLARETKFESVIINTENIASYAESNNLSTAQQLYKTCAHELGHSALKLIHVPTIDESNLMHPYSDNGIILRKFQWDIFHGIISPDSQYEFLNPKPKE